MRGFKYFKGSDARCPSIHFLFYADGIGVKSYYYYSVQFVRKKALAALSVKILKHCIQRNLSMCTRNWQNHSCTVNRTAGELHSQRWTTKSSI